MASNDYRFRTEWRFDATIDEVAAILEDVASLSTWWPTVYLRVDVLEPGCGDGVGKRVRLLTKGWLPYKLRWDFVVTDSCSPHGFTIKASGDFDGTGEWTLEQQGSQAHVAFDWVIRADKPLLRHLSFLLKPVFQKNHEWAMKQGERSLAQEISRRRQM